MKFLIAVLFPFVLLSCGAKVAQKMEKSTITYQAVSRGFYLKAQIQGNKMSLNTDRTSAAKDYVVSDLDLKELNALYGKINLKGIETYKAPTEKRFYDGAAIANLTVDYQGQSYSSQGFDHGNPPAEIADFINKIVALTEK